MSKSKRRTEFGDFQTPMAVSRRICDLLFEQGVRPVSIVEPTCGEGNLLLSALDRFTSVAEAVGVDINPKYIRRVENRLAGRPYSNQVRVLQGDFFHIRWGHILDSLPEPILVIGNPPWVTSSELSSLESTNLPAKTNFQGLSGLEARTGKSNFDISEWMLIHLLEHLDQRNATMAMLCKTSVARKVLAYAWKRSLGLTHSRLYLVNAKEVFDASVDACLLVCDTIATGTPDHVCHVYNSMSEDAYRTTFGYRHNRLVADIETYERWKHLENGNQRRWRSGIKHDCARVIELEREEHGFRNGLGEWVNLETEYVYPMLKGSDIATGVSQPSRWMLVTQRTLGEDTAAIRHIAPNTWTYLTNHGELLDGRKSSVYRGQPRFSVFGVGEYSFAPWKVAISGLYKRLHFTVVGPYAGKPVVLDDTCYFLPCRSEEEARYVAGLLNSHVAAEFLCSFIFWDAKRPITIGILERLSLEALARELGAESTMSTLVADRATAQPDRQLTLEFA